MRERISTELNTLAQDLVRLGKRCADAGRDWLSDRRSHMNRNPYDNPYRSQQHDQQQDPRDRRQAQDPDMEQRAYGRQGSYREDERGMGDRWTRSYRHADAREHAYDFGYNDQRYQGDYPRTGYDLGYGGPGGYAPRTGGERSFGQREPEYGRGYGGSDYRHETYAGRYDAPYERDMPSWRERMFAGQRGEQRSEFRRGTESGAGRDFEPTRDWTSSYAMGFRGHGPKNYTRSDERIREEVCERLSDADDIDASDITVEVRQGIVTLEGEVGQRRMKYRAEDLAESCSGVRDIENRLRVREDATRGAAGQSAQSRYSPTGESQQREQREYGHDIGDDISGVPRH